MWSKRISVVVAALLVGAGGAWAASARYDVRVHREHGAVWAEFVQAGESCRYTAPGTILCYSTRHTRRGDYGVFFTPTRLEVVQYEPGRFASRYSVKQH